jgi:hypothetical protein
MGLDMYLSKKTYVKQWAHNRPEEKFDVEVKKGGEIFKSIKPERVSYVIEEVAYWRKFNALHAWFIQQCADGVDECQPIYVSSGKIRELLETLQKVKCILESSQSKKAQTESVLLNGEESLVETDVNKNIEELENLFPTAAGFFFGSTEYDEYYEREVSETIELIESLLEEEGNTDYEYQASW